MWEYIGYDVDKKALTIARDSPLPPSNTSWVHQDILLNGEMEIKERNNVILIGSLKIDELDEAWSKVRLWFGIKNTLEE